VLARSEFNRLSQALFRKSADDFVVPLETRDQRALEVAFHRIKEGMVVVIQDITERRTAEAAIYRMVWFDPVTGLPNRRRFEDRLSKALLAPRSDKQNGAILFLDLDDFKQVNDSLGHARGDKLLSAVGERLRCAVEESDVVARWGGDEFAILLSARQDTHEPSRIAERIIREINRPFQIDGYEIVVGASVGVAMMHRDGLTLETFAEQRRFGAVRRQGGGPQSVALLRAPASAFTRRAAERSRLICGPPSPRDDRSLLPAHQQRLDPGDGRLRSARALASSEPRVDIAGRIHPHRRGARPDGGTRPHDSSPRLQRLRGVARADFVAVNLSPLQVRGGRVAQAVKEALESSGLCSHRLEVEITESTILHDLPSTRQTLRLIREMGVRISLDDFGTGYSSLSYLHTFPLDKSKSIDRSPSRSAPTTEPRS